MQLLLIISDVQKVKEEHLPNIIPIHKFDPKITADHVRSYSYDIAAAGNIKCLNLNYIY